MDLLGLDVGSSSIKAAVLRNGRIRRPIVRVTFPTSYAGTRAEVSPDAILLALRDVIRQLGPAAKGVDAIVLAAMAPSWVAMDKHGRPLTPIITHQDRRSVDVAKELEQRVGKQRLLRLAGNRPFPGGISSTTCAWFVRHQPALMRKATLIGHLNTFLHRTLTGSRVTDPSNASFMGLYRTLDQAGWSEELCDAVGISPRILPEILPADRIAGRLTRSAASNLGLAEGMPMTTGMMDTSAAMLLIGAKAGQLLNVSGSTDVLALCTDRPRPDQRLLTRALGVGRRWMSVSTLAAAGSAITWAKDQLFPDLTPEQYRRLLMRLSRGPNPGSVRFEPYLAGDRMSIEQRQGAFVGLTLASTRQQMLSSVIESLAAASAARLPLLQQGGTRIRPEVYLSGGTHGALGKILHRDWPGKWTFKAIEEATLRGLGTILPT